MRSINTLTLPKLWLARLIAYVDSTHMHPSASPSLASPPINSHRRSSHSRSQCSMWIAPDAAAALIIQRLVRRIYLRY